MTTIEDVARLAGVSSMTVSRVINGSGKVSAATREKVNKAIGSLNYHPNMMAKALASGNSNTFAYVTPDISDPYFGAVFKGAEQAVDGRYYLIYNSAGTASQLSSLIETLIYRGVAGVVFHDLDPADSEIKKLLGAGISCVLVDNERRNRNKDISTIDMDHREAARHVGELFAAQGYRRVACVHGSTGPVPQGRDAADVPRRIMQRRIWTERKEGFAAAFISGNEGAQCEGCDTAGKSSLSEKTHRLKINEAAAYGGAPAARISDAKKDALKKDDSKKDDSKKDDSKKDEPKKAQAEPVQVIDIEVDLGERADNYLIGQRAAQKLMKYIGPEPLAVYCAEDVLALGVKCYMQEHGVKIPKEIAVFGTDGLDMGMTLYPRLSTVVHPRMRIGQMAVEELIATAIDKNPPIHNKITLEDFFCGDTTKKF